MAPRLGKRLAIEPEHDVIGTAIEISSNESLYFAANEFAADGFKQFSIILGEHDADRGPPIASVELLQAG